MILLTDIMSAISALVYMFVFDSILKCLPCFRWSYRRSTYICSSEYSTRVFSVASAKVCLLCNTTNWYCGLHALRDYVYQMSMSNTTDNLHLRILNSFTAHIWHLVRYSKKVLEFSLNSPKNSVRLHDCHRNCMWLRLCHALYLISKDNVLKYFVQAIEKNGV